jgi:hypothetical protein
MGLSEFRNIPGYSTVKVASVIIFKIVVCSGCVVLAAKLPEPCLVSLPVICARFSFAHFFSSYSSIPMLLPLLV